jgi:hypothetical protein
VLSLDRRRSDDPGDDAGVTLIELIVSGVLSLVVGSMAVAFLFSATDGTRRADGQNELAATARSALNSWSLLLRLAVDPVGLSRPGTPRFLELGEDSLSFCVALESKADNPALDVLPIGAALSLLDGQLIEQRWLSCTSMLAGDPANIRRVIANNVELVGGGTWLVTPLAVEDLPTGVSGGLLTSTLLDGSSYLDVTDPDGYAKIVRIAGVQLAFRTISDPRRPAPSATYSTVIALTVGA